MLFLSLVVYIVLLVIYLPVVRPVLACTENVPDALEDMLLFAAAFALTRFALYLAEIYHEGLLSKLQKIVSKDGIRRLAFVNAAIVMFAVLAQLIAKGEWIGGAPMDFMLPVFVVSILNAFGIELFPKVMLKNGSSSTAMPKILPDPSSFSEAPDLVQTPPGDGDTKVVVPQSEEQDSEIQEFPTIPPRRNFEWTMNGKRFQVQIDVREAVYRELASRPRNLNHNEWGKHYVCDGITAEIREVASELAKKAEGQNCRNEVDLVLSFVQQVVKYTSDGAREYPRYPLETLHDSLGDCEDFVILAAAILKCLYYDVALLLLPEHVALGVAAAGNLPGHSISHDGVEYYYCEMTANHEFGSLPEDCDLSKAVVLPVPEPERKIVLVGDEPRMMSD